MKGIFTTLLGMVIFCNLAQAQIHYGVKAGFNSVNAHVVNPDGTKPSTTPGVGFYAGGYMKVPFDNNLYFVPAIQYSYKNYTIHYNNSLVTNCKMQLNYIETPLLLNYDFQESGNYFFIQAGPSFSFALSGKKDETRPAKQDSSENLTFAYTAYGRFEANAVLNLGYRFQNNFSIVGGYSLGLGSIVNDDNGPVIKHRMFTLGLQYQFER